MTRKELRELAKKIDEAFWQVSRQIPGIDIRAVTKSDMLWEFAELQANITNALNGHPVQWIQAR
jgi:hypothetical protein